MEDRTRKLIYLFLILSLAFPLFTGYTLKPAPSSSAEMFFNKVESLSDTGFAFIAIDFGPQSKAENEYQARVVIEHLMRKRVPIVLFSLYILSEPILETLPYKIAKDLEDEYKEKGKDEKWQYGADWINLGYRPGGSLFLQAIAKSDNLQKLFAKDSKGNALRDFPKFSVLRTLQDISFLGEFTALVGVLDSYLQFFKSKDYSPIFGHGCTSITIPESHIYLDSGQIDGLIDGIAGASFYEELLNKKFKSRDRHDISLVNTGVGIAELFIVLLIVLSNVNFKKFKGK